MSASWEIISLNPQGIPAKEAVYAIHKIISESGGYIDEDCFLTLQNAESISPDVECIIDADAALDRLATWPTLGGIEYVTSDGIMTIEYAGADSLHTVQFFKATLPDVDLSDSKEGEIDKQKYIDLAKKIHQQLRAIRTIMDWNIGLLYGGDLCNQEMERLEKGAFTGEYFVDMKKAEQFPDAE